jgi:hypothetical protein
MNIRAMDHNTLVEEQIPLTFTSRPYTLRDNVVLLCKIIQAATCVVIIVTACVAIVGGVFLYKDVSLTLLDLRTLIEYAIKFFKSEGIIQ